MKIKKLVLISFFLISVSSFSQKNEIKIAEKAIKNGDLDLAKTTLENVESLVTSSEDLALKAQYYFVKGNVYFNLANKKIEETSNLKKAVNSYRELFEIEKKSGKNKYTKQSESAILAIKSTLINSAIEDNNKKNYTESASKLYDAYELNKKDTINLYYAASSAVQAKDYDTAVKYYEELAKLGFTGKSKIYRAKNKLTGEVENFADKNTRDLLVKGGSYIDPSIIEEPSKRAEIVKNIAFIYTEKGDKERSKQAVINAREENPDDINLLMIEANSYLEENENDKYENLIQKVLQKDPNNHILIYNLAVISNQAGKRDKAIEYYKKAILLNPSYLSAYLNLAVLYLDEEKILIDQMNSLGTSKKDNERYDVLKKEREKIFKTALPYLEKAHELDLKNEDVAQTLMNVYGALDMTDKYNVIKSQLKK